MSVVGWRSGTLFRRCRIAAVRSDSRIVERCCLCVRVVVGNVLWGELIAEVILLINCKMLVILSNNAILTLMFGRLYFFMSNLTVQLY